jgi:hypothetical protein
MDDNWDARSGRGEATNDSGFATVSVHYVRLLRSKDLLKRAKRLNVFPRPNRANQFGNDTKGAGLVGKLPLKGTFLTVG